MELNISDELSYQGPSKSPILRLQGSRRVTPKKLLSVIDYCTSEQQEFHPYTLAGLLRDAHPSMSWTELNQAQIYFEMRVPWRNQTRLEYGLACDVVDEVRANLNK